MFFLLFDSITRVMKVSAVLAASVRLDLSENLIVAIGITLLVCTLLDVIPRTSILAAILLTGYLGGAVAIQPRVANPRLFPVYFGVLVWLGRHFREARLRALVPLRG